MLLLSFVKESKIEAESTIRLMMYSSWPIRLQIFCTSATITFTSKYLAKEYSELLLTGVPQKNFYEERKQVRQRTLKGCTFGFSLVISTSVSHERLWMDDCLNQAFQKFTGNSLRDRGFIKIIEPVINFDPGFQTGSSKLEPPF